ncbi:MAG: DNA cytosine methyltransferase, partial [Gallionella sp.]
MSKIFQQIEATLLPLASEYAPEGTEPKAIAQQWIQALAYGFTPFAAERGGTAKKLIAILKKAQLYTDAATLKSQLPGTPIKPPKDSTFTFIDLFAGIGGMKIGFQKAGGRCVFSSEFEKNAQATYADNHGVYPFGDITKISVADIPDHDVLVAGFPCQPFLHADLK